MATPLKDETGNRYGRLTVLERQRPARRENNTRWVCRCDCGTETVTHGFELRRGCVKSCGCLRNQNLTPFKPKLVRYAGAEYA